MFPAFWVPIVNQEQVEGSYALNQRGNRDLLMVLGHLRAGVTPAQAVSDLNSIGTYLEKTYPKDDSHMTFALGRPGLTGDWLAGPIEGFLTGLMLLAGLILLAVCANLGTLFAARASDRSRELAVRLALGAGRIRLLRKLFTESLIVSLLGGAAGLWAGVLLLRTLSMWQPLSAVPIRVQVNADAHVYGIALLLALASGILSGAVPVRQILRTDPYQVIKAGSIGAPGRRIKFRDLLLAVQIAICAVLVTSSLVAVRGLVRSLHSNFGFEPQHVTLVGADLTNAGYSGDSAAAMQKRMIEAMGAISGVVSVGLVDRPPLYYGANSSLVFADKTTDLTASNAAAESMMYRISPEYLAAARTVLLTGRSFTWHDDKGAPRVAIVNRRFADKILGSVTNGAGGYFELRDGSRIQVVGIVENGKYASLTEDPQPAMFLPILQSPLNQASLVVRSNRDPQQLTEAVKKVMRDLDPGLPFDIQTWDQELEASLLAPRIATVALGVLGFMAAMLAVTGVFGMAAYSVSKRLKELGIRMALGARGKAVLRAALGRPLRLLVLGSVAGLLLGLAASRVLSAIVYQATPRDPLVLTGVVLAMAVLGLLATWIPAQRVLSIDPLTLLREE